METQPTKTSFEHLWELLSPSSEYADRKQACRGYWNALSLQRQRQIYYTLREQKRKGIPIDPNPYFALYNCNPAPTNLNKTSSVETYLKEGKKLVTAKYGGMYGIYTKAEAELFEMQDIKDFK